MYSSQVLLLLLAARILQYPGEGRSLSIVHMQPHSQALTLYCITGNFYEAEIFMIQGVQGTEDQRTGDPKSVLHYSSYSRNTAIQATCASVAIYTNPAMSQ